MTKSNNQSRLRLNCYKNTLMTDQFKITLKDINYTNLHQETETGLPHTLSVCHIPSP